MTAVQFQTLMFAGAALYLLPAMVAVSRGHRHQWAIVGLDLCLGWTGLGWIAALIWSRTTPQASRKQVKRRVGAQPGYRTEISRQSQASSNWDDGTAAIDTYRNWLESGATLDAVDRRFAVRLVASRTIRPPEMDRRAA